MRPHPRRILLSLALTMLVGLGAGPAGSASALVLTIPFGAPGDLPVVGHWTGDQTTFIGVYRPSTQTFYLSIGNAIGAPVWSIGPFGAANDVPVVGHWCASVGAIGGGDKPAVYRPSTNTFFVRCTNESPGFGIFPLPFGTTNDLPVAGDWTASGVSTIGVYRPSTNTFFLSDFNVIADIVTPLGAPGDLPVIFRNFVGVSLIGVYRPSTFFLSGSNTSTSSLTVIPFGAMGDLPLIGDWTGDGAAPKVGVYRPSTNTFFLKTTFP